VCCKSQDISSGIRKIEEVGGGFGSRIAHKTKQFPVESHTLLHCNQTVILQASFSTPVARYSV
jgi:hypothetical protein